VGNFCDRIGFDEPGYMYLGKVGMEGVSRPVRAEEMGRDWDLRDFCDGRGRRGLEYCMKKLMGSWRLR
jgi:hypothetical protein